MGQRKERSLLLLADSILINAAWLLYYAFRVRSGAVPLPIEPELTFPMVSVYVFWLAAFLLAGLYRPWYAASRLDEITLLLKTVTIGCLLLFFSILVDDVGTTDASGSRGVILAYWAVLFVLVAGGRMAFRSIQRRMLIAGIGVHNTVIVGSSPRMQELSAEIAKYPAMGFRIVGLVSVRRRARDAAKRAVPILGKLPQLSGILERYEIRDVIIALDSSDHSLLLDIIGQCNGLPVSVKIVPDLYDIISGQARTNQIYGFPLIEISPQLMPPWEEAAKRGIDVAVSLLVLALGLPLWLLVSCAIVLDSPGSVFYNQERVGRDGVRFKMHKFRSMRRDAERGGPQWAGKHDPRVTRVGRILRALHIDEIPQVWNVLKGDMSLIGPRPERPMFVEQLSKEIPLYTRRLKVRPGVTGWAQVKHKYDESIEDVRKKIQYDLFYIENMSLRMDFKIILSTLSHMLMGKGH
jgi:exopolysaccharide biosynthesis polyprenyl glycosylphosphotransferase